MSDAAIERSQPSTVTEGDGEQMSVHDLTMAEQVGLIHQVAGGDGNTVFPEEMIGEGNDLPEDGKRFGAHPPAPLPSARPNQLAAAR